MNKHIFTDKLTATIGSVVAGKKKFFANSIDSSNFEEQIKAIKPENFSIQGEGIYDIKAQSSVGELDPAFLVAKWLGKDYPTIIYHHGNNEQPFVFKKTAKNTFYNALASQKDSIDANLIVVRAPFHNSGLKIYQEKMTELKNFVAMIATSVKLNESLCQYIQAESQAAIITTGISLGGWVSNLHRAIYNSSTAYAPLMAGTFLGELFLKSKYRKMASKLALNNPEQIRSILNFDELFQRQDANNLFPLLGRYDQFIEHKVQKESYKGYPLKTIECGHVTGAINSGVLREHILQTLNRYKSNS
jgi:hypothetical protein